MGQVNGRLQMKPLCLDLGTTTGWAVNDGAGLASGTQSFSFNARYEGGGMRFLKMRRWLDEMRKLTGFDHLFFEEVMQRALSIAAGHVYGGFLGTVTAWCEEQGIPYEGIPVGTIKKFATGKGNAGKDQMIAKAVQLAVRQVKDDNEADAICLLFYIRSIHEAARTPDSRPAPDSKPARRVPVGSVPVARRSFKR